MAQHDIVAVVRHGGFGAEVDNGAVGGGLDRVDRFAPRISSKAFDVETFVHLPAVRSHATKPAGGPRFSDRADKKLLFAAGL